MPTKNTTIAAITRNVILIRSSYQKLILCQPVEDNQKSFLGGLTSAVYLIVLNHSK